MADSRSNGNARQGGLTGAWKWGGGTCRFMLDLLNQVIFYGFYHDKITMKNNHLAKVRGVHLQMLGVYSLGRLERHSSLDGFFGWVCR